MLESTKFLCGVGKNISTLGSVLLIDTAIFLRDGTADLDIKNTQFFFFFF